MRRSPRVGALAALVLVVCVVACGRARCSRGSVIVADPVDAHSDAAEPSVDAPPPTFTTDLRGNKLLHAFGIAKPDRGGLVLRLSTETMRCDSDEERAGRTVEMLVPSGPEDDYLAGHAVNVSVTVWPERDAEADGMNFGATAATLVLERFALEVGARVRGSLSFDDEAKPEERHSGEGTFDIVLCGGTDASLPRPRAVDAARLAGPLSGTIGWAPFHPRTALGIRYRAYAETFVDGIYFFEDAGVTCAQADSLHAPGRWIELWDVGGTVKSRLLSGAQIAASSITPRGDAGSESAASRATAWIEWAELSEGHVRGRAWATNDPTWDDTPFVFEIGGGFDVTVCP